MKLKTELSKEKIQMRKVFKIFNNQEVQIRSTLIFYLTPRRMANAKKQQMQVKMEEKKKTMHCHWECKLV